MLKIELTRFEIEAFFIYIATSYLTKNVQNHHFLILHRLEIFIFCNSNLEVVVKSKHVIHFYNYDLNSILFIHSFYVKLYIM